MEGPSILGCPWVTFWVPTMLGPPRRHREVKDMHGAQPARNQQCDVGEGAVVSSEEGAYVLEVDHLGTIIS